MSVPASVSDLFDELSHRPDIIVAFIVIAITAFTLPFFGVVMFRIYNLIERRWRANVESSAETKKADNDDKLLLLKSQDGEEFSGRFNASTIKSLRCWPEDSEGNHSISDVNGKATKKKRNKDGKMKRSQESKTNFLGYAKKKNVVGLEQGQKFDVKSSTTEKSKPAEPSTHEGDDDDVSDIFVDRSKVKFSRSFIGGKAPTENAEETERMLKTLSDVGLHGKLATARLHAKTTKIEQSMSDEERQKEAEIRTQQLNAIFEMMQAQGNKFGVNTKCELNEQLKLYSV